MNFTIERNPILYVSFSREETAALKKVAEILYNVADKAVSEDANNFMVTETGEVFTAKDVYNAINVLDLLDDNLSFVLSKEDEE